MSTKRSDQVYFSYLEAAQKFDYFITGISLALVGYLGARYTPVCLGWNPATIELVAIISLLISAIAGLKRIETTVTLLGVMQKQLWEEEVAGALTGVASAGATALNKATGEVLFPTQAHAKAQYHKVSADVISEMLDGIADRSVFWYHARNFLLVFGLALLIFARVSIAYIG